MQAVQARSRPILFSDPMVRAIFDGRKTQTRRVVNTGGERLRHLDYNHRKDREAFLAVCPYGVVGGRLWVRETWAENDGEFFYRATFDPESQDKGDVPWSPSIHMHRDACRLELEITDVRVELLEKISESDAIAEGCIKLPASGRITDVPGGQYGGRLWPTAKAWFRELWDEIYAARGYGWKHCPYVWVISFKICKQ